MQTSSREPGHLVTRDIFAAGSFADIFNSYRRGRVLKLFKKYDYDDPLADCSDDRVFMRRAVCSSEIEAYLRVAGSLILERHTPRFFGHRILHGVSDNNGCDVSSRYLLDCCYEIAYVEGRDEKLFGVREQPPYVEKIIGEFRNQGVTYLKDSSAFNLHDSDSICIIDFGVEDQHQKLDWEAGNGGLSQKHQEKWSIPLSFK